MSLESGAGALGDRVAMPWLATACGACEHCVGGWETLCESEQNMGYSVDGGYAEFAVADARYVGLVPDGVDPVAAAPLTCAGVTTYKAVKVAGTRSSDLVAVFGAGGLGHLAIQYAAIVGGTVVAVDLFDDELEQAKRLGATYTVNARNQDVAAELRALGGVDQAIVTAVSPRAFEQAFAYLGSVNEDFAAEEAGEVSARLVFAFRHGRSKLARAPRRRGPTRVAPPVA